MNNKKRPDTIEDKLPRRKPGQKRLPLPTLTLDIERYEEYLEDCDMTEAQQEEFLQTLWDIIVCFVDMGFGIEPTQAACGELIKKSAHDPSNELDSKGQSLTEGFRKVAASKDAQQEGVTS
ncbi:MAG: hypothetical protein OEY94_01130 [Alphaproteobacteria bacterium]|nr:hypothetical protein [Alphaproteobacteria bacterium]